MVVWLPLIALATLGSHQVTSWAPLSLVKKGRESGAIVLGPASSADERRAAEILSKSVVEMTGTELPIVSEPIGDQPQIDLGFPPDALPRPLKGAHLVPDGFAMGVFGQNLYIRSGGKKGSIYAVVDLLETKFGCRCYSPTAQAFPKRKDLSVRPFTRVDNPINSFRCVNGDFTRDQDYLDWQRLNTTDEVFARGYYVHTFGKLVPPETYFASHPEYFALVDGRRVQQQLCPSRPENVEIAVAQLKKEMALQPDKRVWSVSQNDNPNYCHCPECMKIIQEEGSPSGPLLRFVNEVAKYFPNKTISTLAYEFSRSAPKLTKPAPNVQIMLCTIELNRGKPIADDPGSADFRKDIEDWGRIASNIYLWDYTVDFSHQIAPFPNLHTLQPNIRYFTDHGAHQQFQQTNTSPGHEFSELKGYLEARLLWNPKADVNAIFSDFLKGYYGAAAPYIQQYISALESAQLRAAKRLDIFESPNNHENDFLSAENMAIYSRIFDQAEAAVANDPDQLERVKTARLGIRYATVTIASDDIFSPRGFLRDVNGQPVLRPEMQQNLDEFLAVCTRNQVRSVNESNLTPRQFYDASLRLTRLQNEGDLAFRKPVEADPPPSTKYAHGDIGLLTNGVLGGSDFKVQWLGWEETDFTLDLDLGGAKQCHEASIDTISAWRSWILHPTRVTCSVSTDGQTYREIGTQTVEDDPRQTDPIKTFKFDLPSAPARFVRIAVEGTKTLPAWHPGAGGKSWVFVDEMVVR